MKKKLLLIVAITLFFLPKFNYAQAPNLGSATTFVLFSSNGAVSNTGTSHLTGNVGTNNGAVTGFGNVNGVMHNKDGASAQCAADLLIAYYQVDTATPAFFPAPLLGNGTTLKAGVYSVSGNATLNLTLNLDAQGNANAIFIFQIEGTFSSNTFSQINLINGAKACNVFWKVEGLVSLASGTAMRGTIIANNAAISMNTGVTLEGRALSTTGAVSINGVNANTPNGCGSAILTGPNAPGLASTACYAIFSGVGSVSNSGITYVTGDVGTNAGLTAGYNPLLVTGTVHTVPDGSTSSCAADLLNVYNYLNTLPNDIELLYPPQFGNDLVLTPHTYILNGATVFTDTLYLNAEGNANAVFVIKINGALSTSTYAKVKLINGTQAGNVFWKVEGAVAINNYSDFKGTIVCNNGAISLTTGVVLNGRALTTSGAFSTSAVNVAIPGGCSTLPVSWLYFRGKPAQTSVLLEWGTGREMNNGFFTLEKSKDGRTFEPLATIVARDETPKAEYKYSYTDLRPYDPCYYRISQTDKDGQKQYYNTIQTKLNINAGFQALQYVQGNYINVQTSGALPGNGSIELYSLDGKKVAIQNILLTAEKNTYKIEKPINKGIYLLVIKSKDNEYKSKIAVF